MKAIIFFLLFFQITFAQTDDLSKLLKDASKAYTENDFKLAKELYIKVTTLDPENKDAYYNLAATELNLGDKNNACENFYKVYLLKDESVRKDLIEFCPNFRNGSIMTIDSVDTKPKFVYREKTYDLFDRKNTLNPIYLKILIKELQNSKLLSENVKGKVIANFGIDRYGRLDIKVLKLPTQDANGETIRSEIMTIFKNVVKYIPAKHKGIDVQLWEKWTLPIDF